LDGVRLTQGIAEALLSEGGRVTFARFMELALTHPQEGYYSRAGRVLGRRGDFSTAPSLSPAFNEAVAGLLTELVDASLSLRESGSETGSSGGGGTDPAARSADTRPADARPVGIVELGGGEGHLAQAVLASWNESRQDLRERVVYCIVEVGAGLRARQEEALEVLRNAGWDVRWGSDVAQVCRGVAPAAMVGNEFVDALPVHLVDVAGEGPRESWVAWDGSFSQAWGELTPEAAAEVDRLFGSTEIGRLRPLAGDGVIEVRPGVPRLLAEVAEVMPSGCLVTIDYGEWYDDGPGLGPRCAEGAFRPAEGALRPAGSRRRTVRGYFRHQLSTDPLERVGRQDLTADVDFRALDLHGRKAGFETIVFTSLAAFLAAAGARQELVMPCEPSSCLLNDPLEADRQATVLGTLLDEEGLGGSFKVMVQVRE